MLLITILHESDLQPLAKLLDVLYLNSVIFYNTFNTKGHIFLVSDLPPLKFIMTVGFLLVLRVSSLEDQFTS
jgi:hypothetical protein